MEKTPTVAKSKKSLKTPKTASNQQNATPKMDSNLVLGTRQSLRRTKLGIVAGASPQVAPFYTPGRTTRSMLKVTSDDVLPSYVTPLKSSKRKTVASARTSVVRNNDAQQDDGDKFVRPIPPRTKREDKFQADSTVVDKISTISESVEALSNSETKKDRERARKTAKTNQPSNEMVVEKKRTNRKAKPVKEMVAESSEEDWPSVSILGSTDTPTAQYVRTRKSLAQQSTSSESQLNPNTSGQFVRSRKTDQDFSDNFASTEDDLPSVSFLGTSVTPDKLAPRRRSKLSIEPKANKTVSDVFDDLATKPKPNKRTSLSTRSQKSNQTVEVAIESELKDLPSNELPEQHRKSVQFVRSRKSRKNIIDKNEQTEESTLNGHEENNSTNIESTNMSIDEDDQNNVPSIAVISTKSDVGAGSNVDEDLLKSKMEMPLKKSRISVIDLTDSPFIQNKSVLNETFTPEKEETTVNGGDSEANNQTFTEENNKTAVNDATFSPVPSSDKKVALTPAPTKDRASLNAAAKSTAKKKSPLLKRLQSTPYLKLHARNNLVAPGKLSSAKKAKVVEAAIESIEPPKGKSMDKVKELKVAIESPKVFKFGEQDNKNALFRFSLCAPHLQGRQETDKTGVKRAPNFMQMHNRMFSNIESITETRNRHEERAKLLLSGKKPTQAQAKVVKPVARMKQPKFNLSVNMANAQKRRPLAPDNKVINVSSAQKRRPLAPNHQVNKARLNDEERQERRKQLFKQGSKRMSTKNNPVPTIKGVRMNRRFELMMKNRETVKYH